MICAHLRPARMAISLILCALLLAGCSSSSTPEPSSGSENVSNNNVTTDTQTQTQTQNDDTTESATTNNVNNNPSTQNTTDNDPANDDSATVNNNPADATNTNPGVPDPMQSTTTRVSFDIEVPVYQSNALQVRIDWGDETLTAGWVGDEFWSAVADFPSDTEHQLTVTFSDGNGSIVLGTVERAFKTSLNSAESVTLRAEQFNTDKWDSDNNGVSNLAQLIAAAEAGNMTRILLFSETQGYRHDSIPVALQALQELAGSADMQADLAADSAGVFTDANLANYDAVIWVLTSGDVLNSEEQTAFEHYIRNGGGYAGIHAASDTEYEWPWYGSLVGAYFKRHPVIQVATQNVEDGSHSSTAHLNLQWTRTDEWYDYSINPRAQVNVLLSLDEDSYTGGEMGADHPSAWYHDYDGGRSWYTGGGHTDESYAEPDFRAHLLGGLRYAAGTD